jgi:endonuclease/exonuclease/phosphatase family metal-dependent hydrolase
MIESWFAGVTRVMSWYRDDKRERMYINGERGRKFARVNAPVLHADAGTFVYTAEDAGRHLVRPSQARRRQNSVRVLQGSAVTLLATALLSAGCGALHAPVALGQSPAGACRASLTPTIFPTPAPALLPLRWTAPRDPGQLAALDDWCQAVGPALVAAAPELPGRRSFEKPAGQSDLVVVSWNVHVGAGDVVGLVEQLRRGQFTDGQPVDRFVLLLQEVYRMGDAVPAVADARGSARAIQPDAARRTDIVSVADALDLSLYYVPSMRNGATTSEDRGNAILSTEPLSDLEAIELPFERQRRVAVQATITLADQDGRPLPLRLTNAHLENVGWRWRLGILSPVSRLAQAEALMDRVPDEGPAVLAGDLNTWLGTLEPAYRRFAASFDRQRHVDGRPTFGGILRLDHLFVRLPDGWDATTVRLDRFGSDHHPLLARLQGPDIAVVAGPSRFANQH